MCKMLFLFPAFSSADIFYHDLTLQNLDWMRCSSFAKRIDIGPKNVKTAQAVHDTVQKPTECVFICKIKVV